MESHRKYMQNRENDANNREDRCQPCDVDMVKRLRNKEMRDMRKLVVGAFTTLNGVMQASGGPDEDRDDGFQHGK